MIRNYPQVEDDDQNMGYRSREMYNIICATCKKETQAPFKPKGDGWPVYCRECLADLFNNTPDQPIKLGKKQLGLGQRII